MSAFTIFLANVGSNASHGRVVSPLYADGTFDLIPIPETDVEFSSSCLRYCDLSWRNPRTVKAILQDRWWVRRVHNDPDLDAKVYGDIPLKSSRAATLRQAREGDLLAFFARLRPYGTTGFAGPPGFYLLGGWVISEILAVDATSKQRFRGVVRKNPHVRKQLAGSTERFSLFMGTEDGRRPHHPLLLGRRILRELIPESRHWHWGRGRTALQTVGSYLRSVHAFRSDTHGCLLGTIESLGR